MSAIVVFFYLCVYNLTLSLFFLTLLQTPFRDFKTMQSLSFLKNHTPFQIVAGISLFSMAGVPPFIGFFSKLLILIAVIHANFAILYIFFFSLLFAALYFYLQNIRFLYNTSSAVLGVLFFFNLYVNFSFQIVTTTTTTVVSLGYFLIDDAISLTEWIFNF